MYYHKMACHAECHVSKLFLSNEKQPFSYIIRKWKIQEIQEIPTTLFLADHVILNCLVLSNYCAF